MKFRSFSPYLSLLLSVGVVIAVYTFSIAQNSSPVQVSTQKKTVIFLTNDDVAHATGMHEFYAGSLLLSKSIANSEMKDSVQCKVLNNWGGDVSELAGADLVVHYKKGNKWHLMNKNHQIISQLVDNGVSQMFIHFAVDPGSTQRQRMRSEIALAVSIKTSFLLTLSGLSIAS